MTGEDQIQNGGIDLDSPCASNGDAGDPEPTLDPCTSGGADYLWVASSDGSSVDTSLNFGDVQIKGAEIEGNFRINQHWDIRGFASIMEGEYDDFCDIGLFNSIDFTELDGVNPAGSTGAGDQPDYMSALGLNVRYPGEGDTLTSTCLRHQW